MFLQLCRTSSFKFESGKLNEELESSKHLLFCEQLFLAINPAKNPREIGRNPCWSATTIYSCCNVPPKHRSYYGNMLYFEHINDMVCLPDCVLEKMLEDAANPNPNAVKKWNLMFDMNNEFKSFCVSPKGKWYLYDNLPCLDVEDPMVPPAYQRLRFVAQCIQHFDDPKTDLSRQWMSVLSSAAILYKQNHISENKRDQLIDTDLYEDKKDAIVWESRLQQLNYHKPKNLLFDETSRWNCFLMQWSIKHNPEIFGEGFSCNIYIRKSIEFVAEVIRAIPHNERQEEYNKIVTGWIADTLGFKPGSRADFWRCCSGEDSYETKNAVSTIFDFFLKGWVHETFQSEHDTAIEVHKEFVGKDLPEGLQDRMAKLEESMVKKCLHMPNTRKRRAEYWVDEILKRPRQQPPTARCKFCDQVMTESSGDWMMGSCEPHHLVHRSCLETWHRSKGVYGGDVGIKGPCTMGCRGNDFTWTKVNFSI